MRYEAPRTLEEATAMLAAGGARVLAGGTDLLVQLRSGMVEPDLVVDIKRIPGMTEIAVDDGGWRIGAAVSAAALAGHGGVRRAWPGVVESVELIGSTQIQGRATMAGNLCNASPAADSVPAMIAAGAVVRIAGPGGTVRDVPVEEVATAPGRTSLTAGELVVSVFLPPPEAATGDAYLRLIPRTEMDIAVAGAAVSVVLDGNGRCARARVVLGAVGPRALAVPRGADALVGTALDDTALAALAAAASAAARPIDDKRGTAAYRTKVAGVLARRAAVLAGRRAGERS